VSHPDATRVFRVADTKAMAAAFETVVRVLNPRVHSSETVDCATCHIAPDVASFALSTLDIDVADYPGRFISRYRVDAASKSAADTSDFENIHMLSYLGRTLSVSARVANETAAVLEAINGG
jgi:hypothetical protein